MLRRFATFVLLGPLLIWLSFIILLLPDLVRRPHAGLVSFFAFAILVVAVIAFVPAFVLACIDHAMARRGLSRKVRALVCAVLGYPAALAGFFSTIEGVGLRNSFIDDLYTAGLFGIVPAAISSLVAGKGIKAGTKAGTSSGTKPG